jgi:phage-related baseplate assembly protein
MRRATPRLILSSWETDDRYRRRLWLAGSAFNTAGAEDAYVFWALTTVPALRDASATVVRPSRMEAPVVVVTLLQDGPDPVPTPAQIVLVRSKLHEEGVKPASDIIHVRAPRVMDIDYNIVLELYPGADKTLKEAQVTSALVDLKERKRYLGEDQTLMAIQAACAQTDVQNARVLSLSSDLPAARTDFIRVNKISVLAIGYNE